MIIKSKGIKTVILELLNVRLSDFLHDYQTINTSGSEADYNLLELVNIAEINWLLGLLRKETEVNKT